MTDIEQFYNIYNSPGARTVLFREIKELLTPEVLKSAADNEKFSVYKLDSRISFYSAERHDFWQRMLQLRNCLRPRELLNLWYYIVSDRTSPHHQCIRIPLQHKRKPLPKELKCNSYLQDMMKTDYRVYFIDGKLDMDDKKLLCDSSLTDALMIDNPAVINRYCQVKKPGFEMLRYVFSRRAAAQRMPEKMRQAIIDDNAEAFMIYKDISGIKLTYSLLAEIMENRAFRIFAGILEDRDILKRVIPVEELAACCTIQFEDPASTAFLECIENAYPGTIKNARDIWGRNLLWYAVYNRKTAFIHPSCKLTELLLRHGCDPDNQNQLGFSWRYMVKNLDLCQKKSLWARCFSKKNPAMMLILPPEELKQEAGWMKNL